MAHGPRIPSVLVAVSIVKNCVPENVSVAAVLRISDPLSTGVTVEEKFVHRCPVVANSETATGELIPPLPIVTGPDVALTVIPAGPSSRVVLDDNPTSVVAALDANTSPLTACVPERETVCVPERKGRLKTAVSPAPGATAAAAQLLLLVLHARGASHDGAKKPAVPLQYSVCWATACDCPPASQSAAASSTRARAQR